jgi:hypothetical protein
MSGDPHNTADLMFPDQTIADDRRQHYRHPHAESPGVAGSNATPGC